MTDNRLPCGKRPVADEERRTAKVGRRWVRWTAGMKDRFLDHLAATCNVKASAAEIGVDPVSVYRLRRNDPRFAGQWADALAAGYEMLETQLVGHALAGGGAVIDNGADAIGPIDKDLALRLLSAHRGQIGGKAPRGGPKRHVATRQETDAAILRKLAAMARSQAGREDGA